MSLATVRRGRLEKPKRVLLYGCEGIGKSTFAAGAPATIFLGAEDGTTQLDVARFPEPRSWADCLQAVEALTSEEHNYKTLAVDTLDWLEPLCWAHVCEQGKKTDIEAFGYGKGYAAALDQWRALLAALDRLREARKMDIILLAHSHIRSYRNPEGNDFDRYELKLNQKAAGLCKEWPDAVLFAHYETWANTEGNRTRGVSTGARIIHSERRAAFDAKNRYNLPERFPLGWDDFIALIGQPGTVDELTGKVRTLLADLEEPHATTAASALERAGTDATKLAKLVDWMNAKIETTTKTETETRAP
jgi:hypothetical protein